MNGGKPRAVRVGALQPETVLGDVDANLAGCERLADAAARDGARWIVLPEMFTTGMGFVPELAERALQPDGPATELLLALAARHDAVVGGSFLCHDDDGHVRNAFLLATPGGLAGRHDKDIPTMWENCFYVGGDDEGLVQVGDIQVGVALCLEFNRTATVRRLRGGVDLVVGGSCKWGAPHLWPLRGYLQPRIERYSQWAPPFARLVGAPVVDANHCGPLACRIPFLGLPYRSELQGGTVICDARGHTLARRAGSQGAGIVVADVVLGRTPPSQPVPDRYWITDLDVVSKHFGWRLQGWHGRRWYRRRRRAVRSPARGPGSPPTSR